MARHLAGDGKEALFSFDSSDHWPAVVQSLPLYFEKLFQKTDPQGKVALRFCLDTVLFSKYTFLNSSQISATNGASPAGGLGSAPSQAGLVWAQFPDVPSRSKDLPKKPRSLSGRSSGLAADPRQVQTRRPHSNVSF